jgi:hypothetical protein
VGFILIILGAFCFFCDQQGRRNQAGRRVRIAIRYLTVAPKTFAKEEFCLSLKA